MLPNISVYVIKVNGLFFVNSAKNSNEYPNARKFLSYDDVYDAIELYKLTDKGHVEVFCDYGTDNETVEDV